jgi:endo-1,4-beta-D-glucanase Y
MTRDTVHAALLLTCVIGCGNGAGTSDPGGQEPEPPPPVDYGPGTLSQAEHGNFPTTVSLDDASAAYQHFVATYTESCGANGLRVRTDREGETLSEGIGQAALLAVGWDDQATFDGLLTYYQAATAQTDAKKGELHGLMGWRIWGDACNFTEVEPGAASHADLNMAMALLQAECRWGGSSYYYAALGIMDAIRLYMTAEVAEGTVLLPSDMGDSPGCMNASYSAPAYYRVFAKAQPEQAGLWDKMADDSYVFLNLAADPTTGLVPDWSPIGASSCSEATNFVGYDAIRTHWRAATDYAWFGTERAHDWLEHVTVWVDTQIGSDNMVSLQDGFFSDGSEMLGDPAASNSAFLGAIAVGTMPVSQEASDRYHQIFRDVPPANDASYYTVTARALYLMFSVNQFSPGCY